MLKVESLSVAAGSFRLHNIDLKVAEGECHAVLGPSGSGKSTLLHAVLGILPPLGGSIRLNGEDVTHTPIERRGLGYLPQQTGLFPHLSVRENLSYSPRARGLPAAQYQPLVNKLVEATGIGELLGRLPQTLSGGERQRVGLVRALASQPRLVLLDEPFASLNESLRQELWGLLRELQLRQQLTVLLVTHNLIEAYFLAGKISVLMDGRIGQTGDKASVYRRPATRAIARFLGINNLWDGVVTGREGDRLTIKCPAAGITVSLPEGNNPPALQTRVTVGILPEHIAFRDATHPPKSDEHILTGRIHLMDLGPRSVVQFHPAASDLVLEFHAGRRMVQHFDLTDGQTDIMIGLPHNALFWMHNDE
ncbi:MAG: ABC transporter ATP-binding protein [Acidobacteria bacterium]|nr:ABC transporter ATP-binding protein [Acidobacteriota bacterium]